MLVIRRSRAEYARANDEMTIEGMCAWILWLAPVLRLYY